MKKELNKLLKLNIDAAKGYAYTADKIENENFKNFLNSYATQREKYADEIRTNMIMNGFKVEYDTSLLGDIHNGVMKLKENLIANSDTDLIAECIRGENESLSQYDKVLKQNTLTQELKIMALEHFNKIRAAESTLHEIHKVL